MNFAENISLKTDTPRPRTALLNVERSCRGVKVKEIRKVDKEDVYCLSVPESGNFIANGIVVKNCDALRYALYTHFFGKDSSRMSAKELDIIYDDARGGDINLPAVFRDTEFVLLIIQLETHKVF